MSNEKPADRWRVFIENSPDLIFVVDRDLRITYLNQTGRRTPRIRDHFGRKVTELLDSPDERETLQALYERVLATGEPTFREVEYESEDSGLLCYGVQYIPVLDEHENVVEIVVAARDETERQKTEKQLRMRENQYRHVIENSIDLVTMFDFEMRIDFISPNVIEVLGFTPDEIRGMSAFELVHPEDHELMAECMESLVEAPEHSVTSEVRIRHRDGHHVHFQARSRLVEIAPGEERVISHSRDITHRKESQSLRKNLIRADKLAAIGQLAAGVAHEINNPSSFITTNLFVLREYAEQFGKSYRAMHDFVSHLPDEYRARFEEHREASAALALLDEMNAMLDTNLAGMERISLIVRDLRTFSRADSEDMQPVDVNEVVELSCNIVRNQVLHRAKFDSRLRPVPMIVADRGQLTQVLVNLLVNAAHAIEGDPDENVIIVETYVRDDSVTIAVEDTGHGIPEDLRPHIFEPFVTTKPSDHGTGLGLWMCSEIVQKHRGVLEFESELGEGTRFEVRLPMPLREDLADDAHEPAPSAPPV